MVRMIRRRRRRRLRGKNAPKKQRHSGVLKSSRIVTIQRFQRHGFGRRTPDERTNGQSQDPGAKLIHAEKEGDEGSTRRQLLSLWLCQLCSSCCWDVFRSSLSFSLLSHFERERERELCSWVLPPDHLNVFVVIEKRRFPYTPTTPRLLLRVRINIKIHFELIQNGLII